MKLAWRDAGIPFWCWFWSHHIYLHGTNTYLCDRCGKWEMDSFYDGPHVGVRLKAWWWWHIGRSVYHFKVRIRDGNYLCDTCHRPRRLLGKSMGNHEDCWPF